MTQFSDQMLQAMGYKLDKSFSEDPAKFWIAKIASIDGLAISSDEPVRLERTVGSENITLVLGSRINAAHRALTNDDLVEDEAKWTQENKASKALLLTVFGPSRDYTERSIWTMESDGWIHVREGYVNAVAELRDKVAALYPSIKAGVTASFSELDNFDGIRDHNYVTYGLSSLNRNIAIDLWGFSGQATLFGSIGMDELVSTTDAGLLISNNLSAGFAQNLVTAAEHDDDFKSFVVTYAVLEQLINETFKSAATPQKLPTHSPLRLQDSIESYKSKLEQEHKQKIGPSSDTWNKLLFCALAAWNNLNDEDLKLFYLLRKERTDLAHGEKATPTSRSTLSVFKLLRRIYTRND